MHMTYDEAKRHAENGTTVVASLSGGRARRAVFRMEGENVHVRLFRTDILVFYPDGCIKLESDGWHTPSTFDAMGAVLGERPSRDRQGYLLLSWHTARTPVRYGDGMMIRYTGDYDFEVIDPGQIVPSSHAKVRAKDEAAGQ